MQQSLLERTVWELIDFLMVTGQIDRVEDYNLVWPPGFELSEPTKADIMVKEAQARNLQLGWMMVDEVRAGQKLGPLPGGDGQVVVGLTQQGSGSGQPGGEEEQPQENGRLLKKLSSFLRREKKVE